LLSKAIRLATEAHCGQLDKGGKPYILHPQFVAAMQDREDCKIVAYLHDVCEDTPVTFDDLKKEGFPDPIVNAVRAITQAPGISYEEYLAEVKNNPIARSVKLADIRHNMDISRIPHPTEKDLLRLEKYKKALQYLEEV